MRIIVVVLILFISMPASSQEQERFYRGSIPEELVRPRRGESPRYPADIVIGELGQGGVSAAAFSFANSAAAALLSGQMDHQALASVNSARRESYLSALEIIDPRSFRLGGGREEADGSISFLVRFIGMEYGITGELYIRYVTRQMRGEDGEIIAVGGNWVFEELLLEGARDRETEQRESIHRYDFNSYERFF
jgi:hypothetical protein